MKKASVILGTAMMLLLALSSFISRPSDRCNKEELTKFFSNAPGGVDYIMNLFDSVDVVILGERDHYDTTQYDFVRDLISDPRFIENVGYVYTEVGTYNTAPICERVVTADYKDYEEFRDSAYALIRIEDFYPLWAKPNRFQLMENLYRLNSTLPQDKRVKLRGTDISFDWSTCNDVETYRRFLDEEVDGGQRDSVMASNFLTMYREQPKRNGQRKALLITSIPHAAKYSDYSREGYFISRELGNNMRVVFFNSIEWWRIHAKMFSQWLNGIPDSAYIASGIVDCGFNLKDSPLADENYILSEYHISDLADGMIYYLDPTRFELSIGLPGIISEEFLPEIVRRQSLAMKSKGQDLVTPEELINYYNIKHVFNYDIQNIEIKESDNIGLAREPKEAALQILKALAETDFNILKFVDLVDTGDSGDFAGMEIISIGDPFPYAGEYGLKFPVKLKLKDGRVIERNLALKINELDRWNFDGGL